MEIKYTCSLGLLCQSSQILKNNNLKKESYPFDWIFSSCDVIIHCLETNFNFFLDKTMYISIADEKCGHSYYHQQMFNHHNPLNNENDYNYYVRCVNRFRNLLQYDDHKLFVMSSINMSNSFNETIKQKIIDFNDKFSKYTKNYTLLFIYHIKNKEHNYHKITHFNNIDFLELHTLSQSNGVEFINNDDNVYLNNIIENTYKFNL